MNSQSLARGLAFFSIGLGLAELLAPRPLARFIGVDEDNDNLLRLLGLRELGAGMGIMQGNAAGFVWSRVAGDAMDLALLGKALRSRKSERNRVIGAMVAVAGVTVLDVVGGILLSRNPTEPEWRVARGDRAGIEAADPREMREYADSLMAQHESGHLHEGEQADGNGMNNGHYETPRSRVESEENAATQQFGPGD